MLLKLLAGCSPKDQTFDSLTHYSIIDMKEGLEKSFLFFFFPVNNDFYPYFKEKSYQTTLHPTNSCSG